MTNSTPKRLEVSQVDEVALGLAVNDMFLLKPCKIHLHYWRKKYFNSKGIYETKGVDWSK